jgi:hypothetical protein
VKHRNRWSILGGTVALTLIASSATSASFADQPQQNESHSAISTGSFIDSLGVNTHLDFTFLPVYTNLPLVENSIKYLGFKNLRDSAQGPNCAPNWAAVAHATGAKFDDFMGEDSPYNMYFDLGCAPGLAGQEILNYVEGGNEEDDPYAVGLGNTLAITAQFQQQVYATAQSLGLPTINMSFGAGWTAENDWHGDYDKVGDLSPYTDYANAHTYPVPGATADTTIQQLNFDAHLAAASRPVITSEFGYNTSVTDPVEAAKGTLDAALDATKYGDVKLYYYALFDDTSGDFGLMNDDGTPKPAGKALHNLTTLLRDAGPKSSTFKPESLDYTLSGTQNGDSSVLLEKSDGSYWLALWNETAAAHPVTVTLPAAAKTITTFDPLDSTTSTQNVRNSTTVTTTVPDHPILVHIVEHGH